MMVKVLPFPVLLSTVMFPRCFRRISFEMNSPSPVPSYCLLSAVSAWWNFSKIFLASFLGIPIPVSSMLICRWSSCWHAVIAMCPWSVNLMALLNKFLRTWLRRCLSARMSWR